MKDTRMTMTELQKIYKAREKAIRMELQRIEQELDDHERDFVKDSRNWGCAGDLARVLDNLKEIAL